ncbi:MerR family transcriptional regulator, heat shock protein HspR [Corynebacterium appendicis CIP 107643]|uniref:MerR family transcriptional regulator, heat shock protein HspR n=1 Tax=Corynebacterium appendicis CIP 107643 TaxID=1161099 RepID=A0A1N7J851_9CORY|nr:helix-turn-helix transcriptional regulator [Corynebacterium appendicis]MCT1684023.1 helix-turn-helix transcriptional regulator [Corynebacterium appendicis]WJY61943.1 Putative heat shock protein HspR [Corynebacterium appendicis CIP 107643]SIS45535.1 MerR family transcriptional regulator, heat shock protein HspR [Corynebacterium appendicis CIP 107643]
MNKKDDAVDEYYVISVAAELTGMHAQTLRTYDRMGLVSPMRTSGGGRRYSQRDISRLRTIQRLSQEEGVNLAGIKTIIELTQRIDDLEDENAQLRERVARAPRRGGELVHVPRSTAVVAWSRTKRREGKQNSA